MVKSVSSASAIRPLRGADVRETNEKLVLRLIRQGDGLSQSEVAQRTGLKPPTVFRIFANLEERKLVRLAPARQRGTGEKKGRRPVGYTVDPDACFAVGVDFWSRQMSIAIVDFSGALRCRNVVPVERADAQSVVAQMIGIIRSCLSGAKVPLKRVVGIGIGCPGMVDLEEGVILRYTRIEGMVGFPIRERIAREFKVPVRVHNNSAVVAASEYRYGIARGLDSLVLVLIRSGVGGAFLDGGHLFVSHRQTAIEIGHLSVDRNGPSCQCGARGCLEAYLSEEALVADIPTAAGIRSFDELGEALRLGNPDVAASLEAKGAVLALGLRSLMRLLNPGAFVVVSRCQAVSDLLSRTAAAILAHDSHVPNRPPVAVLPREYDPVTAGRGASDLVMDAWLGGESP